MKIKNNNNINNHHLYLHLSKRVPSIQLRESTLRIESLHNRLEYSQKLNSFKQPFNMHIYLSISFVPKIKFRRSFLRVNRILFRKFFVLFFTGSNFKKAQLSKFKIDKNPNTHTHAYKKAKPSPSHAAKNYTYFSSILKETKFILLVKI